MTKKPSAPAPRLHSQQAPKEKKIQHDVDVVENAIRKYFSWDKADTYLMVHADTLKIIITEIIKKL